MEMASIPSIFYRSEKSSNRSASSVHRDSNGISPPETPSTKIKQSRSYSNRSQSLVSLLPGIQPDGDRSVIHSLDLHMLSKSSLRYSSTEFQSQLCQKFLIQPLGFVRFGCTVEGTTRLSIASVRNHQNIGLRQSAKNLVHLK